MKNTCFTQHTLLVDPLGVFMFFLFSNFDVFSTPKRRHKLRRRAHFESLFSELRHTNSKRAHSGPKKWLHLTWPRSRDLRLSYFSVLQARIVDGFLELLVLVRLPGLDILVQLVRFVLAVLRCQLISHHVNLNVRLLGVRVLLLILWLLVLCELVLAWSPPD